MKQVTASAPGKIILFGEHFVVKGTRSIASAISRRVYVSITETDSRYIRIISPEAGLDSVIDPETLKPGDPMLAPLASMLEYIRDTLGYRIIPVTIRVKSELPIGAGLGSSAAFSAAFARAFLAFIGEEDSLELVRKISIVGETRAHGKPSGIDTAMAIEGGTIIYKRGENPLKISLSLPEGYSLIVANTGVERSTREVVEFVLGRADKMVKVSSLLYEAADRLIDLALRAFKSGDMELLGELMDVNQGLLYSMGASSGVIERLLWAARKNGALGAKLTGAGWGGSIIVLVEETLSSVIKKVLVDEGALDVFEVSLGEPGVRVEE